MPDNNPNHVTCPQKRAVKSHRSTQATWRGRKPWKAMVSLHCHVPEARCVHCGKYHGQPAKKKGGKPVYLTINHLSRALYVSEELYTTWNPELMEICCTTCNWMYEKGKEPCPLCKNQYISVMEPDHMCQTCYDKAHPYEAQQRKAEQKQKADIKKALLKKLRNDEKERARIWKLNNPPKVQSPPCNNSNKRKDNSGCKPNGVLVK